MKRYATRLFASNSAIVRSYIHVDFESIESTRYDISLDETCFTPHSEPLTLYLISVVLELQGNYQIET